MASEEEKKEPSALVKLAKYLKDMPGASLLFAIGPLVTLGYLAWVYYGADHLNRTFYSLKQENITQ